MLLHNKNSIRQSFLSLLIVCAVAALSYLFSSFTGYITIALILLVTVSLTAILFDTIPVLIAAIFSALIWDFFFIPPKFTFHIERSEDVLIMVMYFVIVLVNAVLTTQIRQMERVARKKEEKANTVKLYNTLLNSLSHELRTPIATIIAAADNLQSNNQKLSDDNKTYLLSEISAASDRLNQHVENLLNISRIESGFMQAKPDWCDISELIYSTINPLEEKLKGHPVQVHIPQNMPLFKLDFGLMQQALLNLINNAVLYTPADSTISISVSHSDAIAGHFSEEDAALVRDRKIDLLTIRIADNGPGFPPDKIEKAFDKFYRIDQSVTGGTGLGLSITKGFIQAHHGTIKLTNAKAGGSIFTIEIPTEVSYVNQLNNE